jgi:hypothetical protein
MIPHNNPSLGVEEQAATARTPVSSCALVRNAVEIIGGSSLFLDRAESSYLFYMAIAITTVSLLIYPKLRYEGVDRMAHVVRGVV